MEHDDVDEDIYFPQTLDDAFEYFLRWDHSDSDWDILTQTPESKMRWLHSNFKQTIIESCLYDRDHGVRNIKLVELLGYADMPLEEASYMLMEYFWKKIHNLSIS